MEKDSVLISMQAIQKSFGGVQALKNGQLELRKGEVLGLIGENGAGKSTLMNIISGVFQQIVVLFIWMAQKFIFVIRMMHRWRELVLCIKNWHYVRI